MGLIDLQGKLILPPVFEEIHPFQSHIFRTKKNGFWGLVTDQTQDLLAFQYDFIAPLKNQVSLIKKDNQFGLLDKLGNLVVPIEFERVEVQTQQIKAYQKNEALVIYYLDETGNISDHETEALDKHVTIRIKATASQPAQPSDLPVYQVNQFEWFYIAQQDRWGLRDVNNGNTLLNPQFDYIKVLSDQAGAPDLTLVGIDQLTGLVFDQTAYQVEMLFGLVSNQIGKLITPLEFIHIALEDFAANLPAARCIFGNGKHGLVDRNGKVIARDLTYIDDFHHKVARFARNGKLSGAVERSEKLGSLSHYLDNMLSPYYMIDYTSYDQNFQEEANLICQDCTWGYLDSTGKEIVTPAYEFVLPFRAETGLVKSNQKWGMVNRKGQIIIPCQYDGIDYLTSQETILNVYMQADQFGLIDTLGTLVLPTIYNEIGTYSEELVAVKKAKLWGFADPKSNASIPCRYEAVSSFHDGLAAVKQDGKWGFIDQNGHTVIPFSYTKVGDFSEGLAWVQLSTGIGYINKKQEVVIPGHFARATAFKYGIASVMENGKWGLIDQTGKYLARPKFIEISAFDDNGLAIVSYGTDRIRYGVINTQGELLTSEPYLSIQPYSEGLAAVKQKESYGYIDTNGKLVIPAIYSKVAKFMEGRAAVQLNGVCGYINAQGAVAVDFEYSKCLEFSQGRAVIYKGYRKAGLLDELGNYVIEPALNHLIDFKEGRGLMRDQQYRFYYITEDADLHDGYYQDARQFQHGVGVVKMDNLWGIVNPQGIKIIPPKYDQISNFQEGYAQVRVKGFHGLLKATGEQLLPLEYEHIQQLNQQLFRVERGNQIGYFHAAQGWVWELNN
ncbi:MAG: WG repeat-containing protein [Saprospiraceae bacterium]|nr:WG repeat-containing protein [Saprospiraceae bacterium]